MALKESVQRWPVGFNLALMTTRSCHMCSTVLTSRALWSTSGRAGPRRSSPWLGQEYLLQQEFLTSAHLAPDYMTTCRNIIFQSQPQYLISGGGQGERKVYNEDVSQVFPPQSPAILLARKRALSRKILPNSLPLLCQTAPREGASLEALHAKHRHLGARGRHR